MNHYLFTIFPPVSFYLVWHYPISFFYPLIWQTVCHTAIPPTCPFWHFKGCPYNVNLLTLIFLQPLVQPPPTLQKTSPNICPPSPPGKPTGGHGTAARGRSTYLSPLMSSQTTSQEATCPQVVWVISSLQHLDALGVCPIPLLPGEVKSLNRYSRMETLESWVVQQKRHTYLCWLYQDQTKKYSNYNMKFTEGGLGCSGTWFCSWNSYAPEFTLLSFQRCASAYIATHTQWCDCRQSKFIKYFLE